MATTGISIKGGVTNASIEEYPIKRMAIKRSMKSILLYDHDKYDIASLMTYCNLSDINVVVTDKEPPEDYKNFFLQNSTEIMVSLQ